MKERVGIATIVTFVALVLASWPSTAGAIEAVRPTIAVYIVENQPLTTSRSSFPEAVVNADLARLGYKVLPALRVSSLDQMLPRDVGSVWNADRRMTFRKTVQADVLWMGTVEYKAGTTANGQEVTGTVTIVARAFDTATGESLWYAQVKDYPVKGILTPESARLALAETLPSLIGSFDREPKVREWAPPVPRALPLTPPGLTPGVPIIGRTPPIVPGRRGSPEAAQQPYTGIIIDAEHLPVLPSYRSGVYSDSGRPLVPLDSRRMGWAESASSARQQVGSNPLRIRAFSTDGNRIILGENDARRLQQERALVERGRMTILVQPPRR